MKNLVVINVIPSGIGGIQTYGKTLEGKLNEEGVIVERIETYKVDRTKNLTSEILKKITRFFVNFVELSKVIKEYQKKGHKIILHAHIGKGVSFWENSAYCLWVKILGIPFIFHIHSSLLHVEFRQSSEIIKGIRRYILSEASKIIALSGYWKRQLLQIDGLQSEKVVVVYNFIDIERFKGYNKLECRKKLGLPLDKKIIVSIGRLEPEKGLEYLIEAVSMIVKNRNDILCVIIGDGTLKEHLERYTQSLGLKSYIKFVGLRPPEEIPIWLTAADILVLPSLRESFGIVQIEAMACGRPVIASKNGASEKIIISDEYGLLSEPANPEDLMERILEGLEKNGMSIK
ncbi:glycosyl transferase, group 1 [Pyrococcus yayanosii CH1]|uniref:Glycosyl transferase, group 1 n=2 Tax=Pyrococcus TaxID=2260 RepID=F8AHY8_PYRYC|nr:glycosyl transferase, group 1 [Pyrococcus yayanosii CH1]